MKHIYIQHEKKKKRDGNFMWMKKKIMPTDSLRGSSFPSSTCQILRNSLTFWEIYFMLSSWEDVNDMMNARRRLA